MFVFLIFCIWSNQNFSVFVLWLLRKRFHTSTFTGQLSGISDKQILVKKATNFIHVFMLKLSHPSKLYNAYVSYAIHAMNDSIIH